MESRDKIRMLIELRDFKGWSVGAMWEDTKFGLSHFNDIDRLAIVGDKQWEKTMAAFIKPFTTAIVKYFDLGELDAANTWISG
ncbi:MAG: STAS/SEC14 domain-containing protein [Desulfobacula sp.]|nr:STAS/SEC14 domain-containing protein [Desulfobacula sp.]